MLSKIARSLKEGYLGVKRHRAMSFSSSSAVTMTLLIVTVFILFSVNIQQMAKSVEESVQIHAKIVAGTTMERINGMKREIERIDGVESVVFSDKDSELDAFIQAYGQQGELFKAYVGERNPLRDAFLIETVSGDYIESVANAIGAIEDIEKVSYGGTGTLVLIDSLHSVQTGGLAIVVVLGFLAILLIANTIETTISARADEIFIMRTVGASNGFIRWPFIIEGMLIGVLGAFIPILVTVGGYYYLYKMLDGHLFTRMFKLTSPFPFTLYVSLVLLAVGVAVGMIGSFISVTRKLWWKR